MPESVTKDANRCKGVVKKTGKQCKLPPVTDGKYCAQHGISKGRPIIHGRRSRYTSAIIGDSIEKFRNDPDIKCIRDEIAVLRALLENIMGKLTADATQLAVVSPALTNLCDMVGKQVERLVKIEDGLKLTVSVVDIHVMVNQVVEILAQEIDDEDVLAKISKRLQGLSYPAM